MTADISLHRLSIRGELTIGNARPIREQLLAALDQGEDVEVDLAQVTELDSAGVQLLVAAKREAAARQRTIRFTNHSPEVLATLDLLDLTAHLGDPVLIRSPA